MKLHLDRCRDHKQELGRQRELQHVRKSGKDVQDLEKFSTFARLQKLGNDTEKLQRSSIMWNRERSKGKHAPSGLSLP